MIRTKRHACFHVGRGQPSAHHSARDEYQRVGLALGTTFVRIGSSFPVPSTSTSRQLTPQLLPDRRDALPGNFVPGTDRYFMAALARKPGTTAR